MVPKIFLTGATGYIGGDALYQLATKHPDYEISVLVRGEERAKQITDAYPKVHPVLGSLDDSDTIEKAAAGADIVLHTADASDHVGSAKAIAKGLAAGHSKENPGYWLHTGGTGILTYFDTKDKRYGEHTDKIFNDYDGIEELTNLPPDAFHRNVDEIVLETGTKHADSVKTAIVCPPTIFGPGRGPVNTRSRQVYELASFILSQNYVPKIGEGHAIWNEVHVHDLSALFDLLIQAAVSENSKHPDQLWGSEGYYFAENGDFIWTEVAIAIGKEAEIQGLLKAPSSSSHLEVKQLSFDDAVNSPAGFQAGSWGLNSRSQAVRARKLLGWTPKKRRLVEEIPDIVRGEAERLKK